MKLAQTGREKVRRRDTWAMAMSQLLVLFQEDVLPWLLDIKTEQIWQGLRAGTEIDARPEGRTWAPHVPLGFRGRQTGCCIFDQVYLHPEDTVLRSW